MTQNTPSLQLIFDFHNQNNKNNFKEEDFIFSHENESAVKFLQQFFLQKSSDEKCVLSCILKAERCSGKTHLLHIFANKFNAIFLEKNQLSLINFPSFFIENHFYILEDFDEIKNDKLLLHLINSAAEAKSFLILSCKNIDNFEIKDLNSRIKNMVVFEIKQPEQETLLTLISQGLSRRQLKISHEVVDFLATNLQRDYGAIFDAIKKIEIYCHENKKRLTLVDVKKILA